MKDAAIPDNLHRFSGLGECYDAHRPTPPTVIPEFLCRMCGVPRPSLVVDPGCGTGLSTRIWEGRAESILGIEPNADMRSQAEAQTAGRESGIRYQDGLSSATGLPDGCADVVTCSQSLHWMEPEPTFAEAARILRPGGVFAAFDCDWPPAIQWEADAAFAEVLARARKLEQQHDTGGAVRRWAKHEHLARITASGRFRYTHEACFHSIETGDAGRLVGLALSQGTVAAVLRSGYTEADLGLTALRETAARVFGNAAVPWHFTYRLRYGVK
jgi:SAM-dependent methyltransferase